MSENLKSIFIRFNMEDTVDRELYQKLTKEAGNAASLTSYVKRVLEEYFNLNVKIADRQEFHSQILAVVREEMQSQGMKLVGALLACIGTVNVPKLSKPQDEAVSEETQLPGLCETLPEELKGVLELIG